MDDLGFRERDPGKRQKQGTKLLFFVHCVIHFSQLFNT